MHAVPYVLTVASISLHTSDICYRMLEPGVSISFKLAENHGAALVTKYRTYREDVELESVFKAYTKRHYDSWVTFARDIGHGDDRSEEHTSELHHSLSSRMPSSA